jgi:hypothetical protein
MVSRGYQAGLLLVVFGGFLFAGRTGTLFLVGGSVLLLGLCVGVVALLHESANEAQSRRLRAESE